VNLYLRVLKLLLLLPFVRRRELLAPACLHLRVWPLDCDLNLHLNNGRYLTFMDLGRLHLMAQNGLLGTILRRRWQPVLAAAEISFVRALAPFQRFALSTRLLAWDDKYFYLEQRFLRGETLCAVALVKGLFLERGRRVGPAEILAALGLDPRSPELPPAVRHWNDLSTLKKAQAG